MTSLLCDAAVCQSSKRSRLGKKHIVSNTVDMHTDILTIGKTNFRDRHHHFGINAASRLTHLFLLGQTGTGKTTLLESMAQQDITAGRSCIVIDPHGDLSQSLAHWANACGKQITVINVSDVHAPLGYNPIRRVAEPLRPLLASGVLDVFKKQWADSWGVKMEHILRNVLLTLVDQPKASLADISKILTDKHYRQSTYQYITNRHVLNFWHNEFDKYSKRYVNETIAPIMNKVGGFLAHPVVSKFLTEARQNISLRKVMDEGETLLINLSKGELGEDAANLVGSLFMTSIGLAAYSRADTFELERRPCYVLADEFQNFSTLSLVNMASELRKYGLSMTLASQFLDQISPDTRSAIIGNVGSLICFRLGAEDAVFMEKEFYPVFNKYDLINLPNYTMYVRLMNDGKPSRPFSARTIPPSNRC